MAISYSARTGWPTWLAFGVLLTFSVISITTWRLHSTSFVSIRSANVAPQIQSGDAVVTKPIALSRLKTGDLVSYQDPVNPSHIKTGQVQIINTRAGTLGFDLNNRDRAIDSSLVVGKVEYRLAKIGYVLDFVQSPWGLVIAVYIPAMLIIGQEITNLSKSYRGRVVYRLAGFAR